MSTYDKAFVYLDTNFLECRHSKDSLFLSQVVVNPEYFRIEDIIKKFCLSDKVSICIPEIVWSEIREHMRRCFKSEKDRLDTVVESCRKSFGDLFEISFSFEIENIEQYDRYLDNLSEEFFANPRINAKIIKCPKDEQNITEIIGKAIRSEKPFNKVKINGKEYKDAGFKDALIFATILNNTKDQLGIFVTQDNDFKELFSQKRYANLRLCGNVEDVQNILREEFDVVTIEMMESILKENSYLLERILEETEFGSDVGYLFDKVYDCKSAEEGENVDFSMFIGEEKFMFHILYNIDANELLEAECARYEEEAENEQ